MRIFLLLAVLLACLSGAVAAEKVRVVTRNLEPFSFERDGRRVGYAMELWDNIAREMKLDYDVTVSDSAQKMVDALAAKQADVAVGALSITAEREAIIDFSNPFYDSGLDIVVSKSPFGFNDILALVSNLFNWKLLTSLALLLLTMFVISHFVWVFEHKVNEPMWPKEYGAGLWESAWWTVSTLLVGGADNKGPIGVGGRIVAVAWMLLSILLLALLTASFTTTLTLNSINSDIKGDKDLPGKIVATIGGSASERWLTKREIKTVTFPTIGECFAALKDGKVKAVVFDAPILKYEVKKAGDDDFTLVGNLFDKNNYGLGLQRNSTLRKEINLALLTLSERGVVEELQQKWFGVEK